ncbi:hypothetical protein IT568_05675 [bacterium]|nr:hypothetical protein [bacterium]
MKQRPNLVFSLLNVKFILIFVSLLVQKAFCAFEFEANGASNNALGGTHFTFSAKNWLPENSFLSVQNTGLPKISVSFRRKFGLTELQQGTFGISLQKFKTDFALGGNFFGDEIYRETELFLASGYTVLQNFKIGGILRTHSLKIKNYGSETTFSLDFESLATFGNFCLSTSFTNVTFSEIKNDKLPQVFVSSFCWKATEKIIFVAELEKDVLFPTSYHFGTEFQAVKNFCLRFGTQTNPEIFSAGFGLNFKDYVFDYSFAKHRELGATNEFTFSVKF